VTINNKTAAAIMTSAVLLGGLIWNAASRITRLEEQVIGLRADVAAMKALLYIPSIPQRGDQ
jgi:hypothetical protein